MNEYVYPYPLKNAKRNGEEQLHHQSFCMNVNCAYAIQKALEQNFSGSRLKKGCAMRVIEEFGYDRVNWVLANTIQLQPQDGRYSTENKQWAETFSIPKEPDGRGGDFRSSFVVGCHPGIVDCFVTQARLAYKALNLWGGGHCNSVDGSDITGKVMVLSPKMLNTEYKHPEWQLVLCTGGNGCRGSAIGRVVYGKFLRDGDNSQHWRQDFIGELKEELLPDWAKEQLETLRQDTPKPRQEMSL